MKRLNEKEQHQVQIILQRLIDNVEECTELAEFYNERFYNLKCRVVVTEKQLEELKQLLQHIEK